MSEEETELQTAAGVDNDQELLKYPTGTFDDSDASVGEEEEVVRYLTLKLPSRLPSEHESERDAAKPKDNANHVEEEGEEGEEEQDGSCSVITNVFESLKYLFSCILLAFCLLVVHAAIVTQQTIATADLNIHPTLALVIFWFLILWLAMMEGGQGALVGLQSIGKQKYAQTHPRTLRNTNIAHKGDNMERFIIGRQYLNVLVITVINIMGSSVEGASVLGLARWVDNIFLATGVGMILTTIVVGQLAAQINAANCMLDFINNYFMLFTTYVSLAIEYSGLLHCVYLVQAVFYKISGKPVESNEPPRNTVQNLFFWGRVLMSLGVLSFCFAVTAKALFDGNTGMWEGVPAYASVMILLVLMCVVGVLEGMQIALFTVVNMSDEDLCDHPVAFDNCQLAFEGQNLQAFLIGRQILVATCMFVVARIATPVYGEEDENVFGLSDGFQAFLNIGLTGAVITTIVGSLIWRVVASSFPLAFLSNPLIIFFIRSCLVLEGSGLCSSAWILGRFNKLVAGYQPDDVYLKTYEKNVSIPARSHDRDVEIALPVAK